MLGQTNSYEARKGSLKHFKGSNKALSAFKGTEKPERDQIFGQVFGQGCDQGLGEGKNHEYSAQYYPA